MFEVYSRLKKGDNVLPEIERMKIKILGICGEHY